MTRAIVIVFCCILACADGASAAVLYLKGGDEIPCRQVRREGQSVIAKVEGGDLYFSAEEVNLSKTFGTPGKARAARGAAKAPKKAAAEKLAEGEVIVVDPEKEARKERMYQSYDDLVDRLRAPERRRERARKRAEEARERSQARYQ